MSIKSYLAVGAAMLLTIPALAQDSAHTLMERLPQDSFLTVGISDFQAVKTKFEESRFHDAWASPEMLDSRNATTEWYEEFTSDFTEETGLEFERVSKYFQNEVALAFIIDDQLDWDRLIENQGSHMVLISKIDMNDQDSILNDLAKMIEQEDAEIEKSSYNFQGNNIRRVVSNREVATEEYDYNTGEMLEVNSIESNVIEYAFIPSESSFIVGFSKKSDEEQMLAETLSSLLQEGTPALHQNPELNSLRNQYKTSGDVEVFFNAKAMVEILRSNISNLDDDQQKGLRVFESTGLLDIPAIGMQSTLIENGFVFETAALMPQNRKGLVDAFFTEDAFSFESASLAPKDTLVYRAFKLDVGKLWTAIYNIVSEATPEGKQQMDMGIGMANMRTGTDIVTNVLNNIKGTHSVSQVRDPEGKEKAEQRSQEFGWTVPEALLTNVLFHVENDQLVFETLNSIIEREMQNLGLALIKEDFMGTTLWTKEDEPTPSPVTVPTMAMMPGYFTASSTATEIREIIRKQQGTGADSLMNNEDFVSMMNSTEKNWLVYYEYASPDNIPFQMEKTMSYMLDDETEIPPADWYKKYFGSAVNEIHLSPEALTAFNVFYTVE